MPWSSLPMVGRPFATIVASMAATSIASMSPAVIRTSWAFHRTEARSAPPGPGVGGLDTYLGIRFEEQRRERRQRQGEAVPVPMHAHRHRVDAPEVALSAASIHRCIAVEELSPPAALWHTDLVVVARHGREVEDPDDDVRGEPAPPHQADHALVRIRAVDP